MKNYIVKGCLALLSVSLMASCDDFLTENPQSTYTTETFYSTEGDFQYAVNALYQALNVVMDGPTSDPAAYSGGNAYYGYYFKQSYEYMCKGDLEPMKLLLRRCAGADNQPIFCFPLIL